MYWISYLILLSLQLFPSTIPCFTLNLTCCLPPPPISSVLCFSHHLIFHAFPLTIYLFCVVPSLLISSSSYLFHLPLFPNLISLLCFCPASLCLTPNRLACLFTRCSHFFTPIYLTSCFHYVLSLSPLIHSLLSSLPLVTSHTLCPFVLPLSFPIMFSHSTYLCFLITQIVFHLQFSFRQV